MRSVLDTEWRLRMSLGLLGAYLSDSDDSDGDGDDKGQLVEGGAKQEIVKESKPEVRETLANPFLSGRSSGCTSWLPKRGGVLVLSQV